MDIGFLVLCHNNNISHLKNTVASIRRAYSDASCAAVAYDEIKQDNLKEMHKICPTHVGGKSITSLINVGIACVSAEWIMIVMAGTWVRPHMDRKYSLFLKSNKDIFFPIVDKLANFVDATLNGLCIHRDTFKEIGNFSTDNSMEICKLFWALDAI